MTYEVVPAVREMIAEVEAWLDKVEVAYKAASAAYWSGDDDDNAEIPVRGSTALR
jgi:hypothetical protein